MNPEGGDNNTWNEYRLHVVRELARLAEQGERIEKVVQDLHADVAMLKFKAGAIGALFGAIFSALISWLIGRK